MYASEKRMFLIRLEVEPFSHRRILTAAACHKEHTLVYEEWLRLAGLYALTLKKMCEKVLF